MATVRNVMVRLGVQERGFSRGFRAATQDVRKFQRATDSSLTKVRASISGASKALRPLRKGFTVSIKTAGAVGALSALAGGAAVAAQQTIALAAAIAPVSGLLLAIPGAIGIAAVAMSTLRLATAGVGDAFGAALEGNAKKFNEALQKLSPAARDVAREFKALVPTLLSVKNAVQDAFFAPLRGELTKTAKALSGPLKSGLAAVSQQLGSAAADVAKFARSARSIAALRSIIADTVQVIKFFRPALEPVLAGFRDIAVVGAKFFAQIAPAAGMALKAFGEWLSAMARSGQAMEAIRTGLGVLQQLWRILGNIGSLIVSVFKAAGSTGGGLLGTIEKLTGSLAAFARSAEGTRTLRAIFAGIGEIGKALGPVVVALAKGLGQVAPAIGRIALVVGPVLTRAINALAPALTRLEPGITALIVGIGDAIDAIGPVLPAVGSALSSIAVALAPLLPAIGQLVAMLATGLASTIQQLVSSGALANLVDAIIQLALELGGGLLNAITEIAPYLPTLVMAFGELLLAMIPIIGPITDLVIASAPLIPIFADLLVAALPLIQPFADLVVALTPLIPVLTDMLRLLSPLVEFVLPLLLNHLNSQVWATEKLVQAVEWGWKLITGSITTQVDAVKRVISWFGDLPAKFSRWFTGAKDTAVTKLLDLVKWVRREIPDGIDRALVNIGDVLYNAGRSVIQGLINGMVSKFNALARTASSIGEIIAKYLPGSPVREGPLRVLNNGYAGGQIASMIASGMLRGQRMVGAAASGLAGAALLSPGQPGLAAAGLPQPRGALQAGGTAGADPRELARLVAAEVAAAMRNVSVNAYIDGDAITEKVSRRQGQTTALRRRSG